MFPGPEYGAFEKGDNSIRLVRYSDVIDADPRGAAHFDRGCRERIVGLNRFGMADGCFDGNGLDAMRIRGEGQAAIGQGIGDASMRDRETVEHLFPHVHA